MELWSGWQSTLIGKKSQCPNWMLWNRRVNFSSRIVSKAMSGQVYATIQFREQSRESQLTAFLESNEERHPHLFVLAFPAGTSHIFFLSSNTYLSQKSECPNIINKYIIFILSTSQFIFKKKQNQPTKHSDLPRNVKKRKR